MPYMLLIHEPVGQRLTRSQAEGEAVYRRMLKFADELKSEGVLLGVSRWPRRTAPPACV